MTQFVAVESNKNLEAILEDVGSSLPRSAMIYNVIKLKLVLLEKPNEKLDIQIYAFSSEGWMAMIRVKGLPQTIVVIFHPTSPSPQFLQCLENFINWSIPHQFEGVETTIAKFIEEFCESRGRLERHDPIELHYMPIEKALRLLPAPTSKNIELDPCVGQLDTKDAFEIDSLWPARCSGSLEMLSSSIELVGSGGVRILKDESNNETGSLDENNNDEMDTELVSWAVGLPFGSIHALHTKKQYGGRGFAKMTMKSVSKSIAERGRVPVVQIYKCNDASIHLNSGIGYIYSHDINLIHYFPNDVEQ